MNDYRPTFECDDFFDDNFIDSFNDDLVYEYFDARYRDDPLIKVLSKNAVPEGFSRLGMFDVDEECFFTSRDVASEVEFTIKPDYEPILTMFDNFDNYMNGSMKPYKYVPVANPIIPVNKLVSGDEYKTLEEVMVMNGYLILDPTPGQISKCDESNSVTYSDDLDGKYFDKYKLHLHSKAANEGALVVGLEFNPFNPRSGQLIEHLTWVNDTKVIGSYKYREKTYKFDYDLNSRLYRYHSDVWMRMFRIPGPIQHHCQSFDLVSVKRFGENVEVGKTQIGQVFNNVFLEPYYTNRKRVGHYSMIGPWRGDIFRGTSKGKFYVPYLTPGFELKDLQGTERYEILTDYEFIDDEVFFDRENDIKVKYYKGKIYDFRYYCRYTDEGSSVLRRSKTGDRFMYRLPFVMKSEFHNFDSTLVEHFHTIPVHNYVYDVNLPMMDRNLKGNQWGTVAETKGLELKLRKVDDVEYEGEVDDIKLSIFSDVEPVDEVPEDLRDTKVRQLEPKSFSEKVISAMRNQETGEQNWKKKSKMRVYERPIREIDKDLVNLEKLEILSKEDG